MSFDGDGRDSWELDPFGSSELYDPQLALSYAAAQQARDLATSASTIVAQGLSASGNASNQVAASARKSASVFASAIAAKAHEIAASHERARQADPHDPSLESTISAALDGFAELRGLYDELTHVLLSVVHPDPVPLVAPAGAPPQLEAPAAASAKIYQQLSSWLDQHRGSSSGDLLLVKATPGVGKTHQILRKAYEEQQTNRQRVIVAVRTKAMITGDEPELVNRAHRISPLGRIRPLHVLTGRDENTCYRHRAVQSVMAHGYSPGPAVCAHCEHYPDNMRLTGLGPCPYYETRLAAHNDSRAARQGRARAYPLIFTTHASYISATNASGGRWGTFWNADLVCIDEDPTDTMETDTVLTEEQCQFRSQTPDTVFASVAADLFRTAIATARNERAAAASTGFKAPGSKALNSHPVHTKYDSAYTGLELHSLLQLSHATLRRIQSLPSLAGVLRDVTTGTSFHVQTGQLVDVNSIDDINNQDIPPKTIAKVADMAYAEMEHAHRLRTIVFEQLTGRLPTSDAELAAHTEIEPVSYVTRLECLPRGAAKGRPVDEWRFVVREFRPLANRTANIILGDAYAQKEHYERLFDRPADMIDAVATLHPDALITRVLHKGCTIGRMREGGLQEILALVEGDLAAQTKPGDRVLVYGHAELLRTPVPVLEPWLENVRQKFDITIAFEHWWGGRGKDHYKGWEHTYCLSDPVQSLSGIKHVANARAFRDSINARTADARLEAAREQRVALDSLRHGVVHALRNSPARITLEHERMNVSELTQAMHRSRPVYHPTRVVVWGAMEQSADLLAQTCIVPFMSEDEPGAVHVSVTGVDGDDVDRRRTARQMVGTVDMFVTQEEAWRAVRGILDWFGVYSPWFAHALVTLPNELPNERKCANLADQIVRPGCLNAQGIEDRPVSLSGAPPPLNGVGPVMVQTFPMTLEEAFRPTVRRVWDPPTFWQLLKQRRSLPNGIQLLHDALINRTELAQVTAARRPAWMSGGLRERYPRVFYDPLLVKRPDTALALYHDIVDRQYGPVVGGRLHRPHFRQELPTCLKTLPF